MSSWLKYRTAYASDIFDKSDGEIVKLLGWISEKRTHKNKIFLMLRDSSGYVQMVAYKDKLGEKLDLVKECGVESAIAVEGEIVSDKRAPGGKEVHLTDFKIISRAKQWPITPSALKSPGFLFDMRHLVIRGRRTRAILKIKSELIKAAQEYFERNGYVWIQAPTFITSACEGGATLFEVKYFDKKVYLTQSAQLYEEAAICSFEKVYTIQPSFRAEKSRTRRHLTEFWHIEAEVAFASHEDIMRVEEELVTYMISKLIERCRDELSLLKKRIEPPKPPFPRITYDEAINILKRKGLEVKWGEDFGDEAERELSKEFDQPFFVTAYPLTTRSFYHKPDPANPKVTLSSDLMAPGGYGEITSGGERISDYNMLLSRIKEQGLNPEDYRWYLDLRLYGMPPHSGFGLGVERMLRWLLDLKHIRQASLFPRTPSRVYP